MVLPARAASSSTPVPTVQTSLSSSAPAESKSPGQVMPKPVSGGLPGEDHSLKLEFELSGNVEESGRALEAQGKYQEAALLYRQAIQEDPNNSKAWWALGQLYYSRGQKQYAIRCIEKVVRLNPSEKKLAEWLERYKASSLLTPP